MDDIAKVTFGIFATVALLSAWRPRALSAQFGDAADANVQLRPLLLTFGVFFGVAIAVPTDLAFAHRVIVASTIGVQLMWITYRSNPDSEPVVGGGSRLVRFGMLVAAALLGAGAGAALFVVVTVAGRERGVRPADVAGIGALLGVGAGLGILERRRGARAPKSRSA